MVVGKGVNGGAMIVVSEGGRSIPVTVVMDWWCCGRVGF